MDVQALVHNSMLNDGIAFFGGHAACSEAVPGGFDVTLHWGYCLAICILIHENFLLTPFFDVCNIFLAIFDRFPSSLLARIEHIGGRRLCRFEWMRPRAYARLL